MSTPETGSSQSSDNIIHSIGKNVPLWPASSYARRTQREGEIKIERERFGTPKIQRNIRRKREEAERAAEREFNWKLEKLHAGNGSEVSASFVAIEYAKQGDFETARTIRDLIDPERMEVSRYHIKPEWDMNILDPLEPQDEPGA
jgi:hypothetical protein